MWTICPIYQYLDEFVKEQSILNQWAYATLQCWTTFRNHLQTFGKGIEFEDFNESGVNRFIMHLRKTRELLKLYNYEIPPCGTKVKLIDMNGEEYEKKVEEAGALAKTRDLFCFCAFTSLRYSDIANLKRTDVGEDCIYVTTQKTNDRLPIDLNKFSRGILEKYKDENTPITWHFQ